MTSSESDDDDGGIDEAVTEALSTLRESYPAADLPKGADVTDLAVVSSSTEGDLRRDATKLLSMLAERFPAELAEVAPHLISGLDAEDTVIRIHSLRALGYASKSHPEAVRPAVDRLVELLDDDTKLVRNATWTLANLASADPRAVEPAVPRFVDLLEFGDNEVHRHAARGVAAISTSYPTEARSAFPRLLELLQSTALYRAAGRSLVSAAPVLGEPLVDELFDRLESGRPTLREHVAWTLVPLAATHHELLWGRWPELLEIVRDDEDYQVQNSATATLAALACERPESELVTALIGLLTHDDPFVRRYACLALGDVAMATRDPDVLRALDRARDDPMDAVSEMADQQLVEIASSYPDAVVEVSPDVLDGVDSGG